MKRALQLALAACLCLTLPHLASSQAVELIGPHGEHLRYEGPGQDNVRKLLSKVPADWRTPSCSTCQAEAIPPQEPDELPCQRDSYVWAAAEQAWAPDAYFRLGQVDKAQEAGRQVEALVINIDKLRGGATLNNRTCATSWWWQ
mgnify:FL=1